MKIMLIDTTTSIVTVSIVDNDKILYKFHEQIENDMASKIMSIIDDAFKNAGINLNAIDKILVATGPGSFTGIRVGVTIAKTIAWALKKDIISISSLELMATTNTDKKYLVPMIDARRGNVFAGIYDTQLNLIKSDKLVSLNELVENLDSSYEFISYDNIEIDGLVNPDIDILKIVCKHKDDESLNPHNVNPIYLKLTEAEEKREKIEE